MIHIEYHLIISVFLNRHYHDLETKLSVLERVYRVKVINVMKYNHLFTLALGLLVISSCLPTTRLVPDPDVLRAQTKVPGFEYQTLQSPGEIANILISAHINESNNMVLHVVYANLTNQSLTIQPQLINVTTEDKSGDLIPLKVYTAEEYIAKIQADLATERFQLAVESMVDPQPEKLNPFLRLYTENELIPVKSNPFEWSRTVLPSKMKFGDAYNTTKLVMGYKQPLLTNITLKPDQYVEGDVIVHFHKGTSYIITVPVDGEIHRFSFHSSRFNKP